ncbi:4Fe-4S dicluster domain-containing protein [Pseudodesulfovibrio sp. zrk46]|uniref:4Fe-4S dicluster domain-containing protein n=1 Tax=Pseudodesulfovibrio sp. zrk46 TaxID=2725288 RepID=UPI001449BE5E|nr:4Fe-4S dicluster domain-containing protein [Pseudodesulfovibrio sp. zrk46]QJB57132.1 4Fe-4S dicluster domain-containing protein [Pseudodesulfovibrio sp. zrk46]
MDFFDFGLILASVIFIAGAARRIVRWFAAGKSTAPDRNSLNPIKAVWALIFDGLLLARTGRTDKLRWISHTLVFFGFMGLLLFHALDDYVTAAFFPAFESTLDPWQWLRNLFGLMTLSGLAYMGHRRFHTRTVRDTSRFQDWAAILLVAGIILSGFFLEASKIISPAVFTRMTNEFFVPDEAGDMTALKAYWADEYGVVFPETLPMDEDTLEKGAELNQDSCADCHSNTKSAFVSRPLATAMMPLANSLNVSRADKVFWYLHIVFCFIGLATLPFGKFFHPLSAPVNLAARQGRRDGAPAGPFAQMVGLDACTRCGECSVRCSVAPSYAVLGNKDILPSEKLVSLGKYRSEGSLSGHDLEDFAQGSRICTECLQCTDICPVGINLQDLWLTSKPEVAAESPDPNQAVRAMDAVTRSSGLGEEPCLPPVYGLADNKESFHGCVQCTTCTSVCPVVAVSEDPSTDLDLTPQQIMNLLRMGLKDETLGARMVWSCTTCYKCQEHCPQNIKVADILYELRNTAAARIGRDRFKGEC